MMIQIGNLTIPETEIETDFTRSGGPGGQNVNKRETKVSLRWHLYRNASLSPDVLARVRQLGSQYFTLEKTILIHSSRFRSQLANLKDCEGKLRALLQQALTPPKKRRKTRVPKRVNEARLREKKQRSAKKSTRRERLQ